MCGIPVWLHVSGSIKSLHDLLDTHREVRYPGLGTLQGLPARALSRYGDVPESI